MLQGAHFVVKNGHSIKAFFDNWVPLHPPNTLNHNLDTSTLVSTFIQNNGININYFFTFEANIANGILKIHLPRYDNNDELIWAPSPSGKFSIKSTYNLITKYSLPLQPLENHTTQ